MIHGLSGLFWGLRHTEARQFALSCWEGHRHCGLNSSAVDCRVTSSLHMSPAARRAHASVSAVRSRLQRAVDCRGSQSAIATSRSRPLLRQGKRNMAWRALPFSHSAAPSVRLALFCNTILEAKILALRAAAFPGGCRGTRNRSRTGDKKRERERDRGVV